MATGSTPHPSVGVVVREELNATQVEQRGELTSNALAAREMALIQSMYAIAYRNRRKIHEFEDEILKECERPSFAEIARFARPVGIQWNPETQQEEEVIAGGWSIRFAEAAKRCFHNVYDEDIIVYEDDEQRIVRMAVVDLESNNHYTKQFVFKKRTERKYANDREVLGQRKNSKDKTVFIVRATEQELLNLESAQWSKFQRNVLRLMPGDVLDKCLVQVQKTLKGLSPEAARERLVNAFDQIGVTVIDLQDYLGYALSKITDRDLDDLRKTYAAIKEGEFRWKDVVSERAARKKAMDDEPQRIAAERIAKAHPELTVEQIFEFIDQKDPLAAARAKYGKRDPKPASDEQRKSAIQRMADETGYTFEQVEKHIDSKSILDDLQKMYGTAPKQQHPEPEREQESPKSEDSWFGN